MIRYVDTVEGLDASKLQGFFQHWKKPPPPEEHLRILRNSDRVVLAVDSESGDVVGFITALTDGIQAAFIPLLEVLPEYRRQGIGGELVRRMLANFRDLPAVDLTCDASLQPFYARFGMVPSQGMVVRNC